MIAMDRLRHISGTFYLFLDIRPIVVIVVVVVVVVDNGRGRCCGHVKPRTGFSSLFIVVRGPVR